MKKQVANKATKNILVGIDMKFIQKINKIKIKKHHKAENERFVAKTVERRKEKVKGFKEFNRKQEKCGELETGGRKESY